MNRRQHLASAARVLTSLALPSGLLVACARQESAPEVAFTLLDGRSIPTSALRGKVTLVNFWATSCSSCVQEMPELISTYEKFKSRSYDTIAVAMSYDRPEHISNFAQSRQLPFSVAHDQNGQIAKAFGDIRLTPTSILIDKTGHVVKRYVGPPDFSALHQLLEQLVTA